MPHDFKKVAIDTCLKAGELLKKNLGKVNKIKYKGEINLVTEMDHKSEDLIIKSLTEIFPHHSILSEEREIIERSSPYKWIVDPLDGTTNFAHSLPIFCVTVALEYEGEVILGIIYNPNLDELFVAERKKGAFLNNKKISVSPTEKLSASLLATGFPYDIRTNKNNNLNHFANFAVRAQAVRRAGSAALDLAYLACGRFDGFWEFKLAPWDSAAGVLLVREAVGKVTDYKGNAVDIYKGEVLASNGKIHPEMIEVLNLVKEA
ncbi:MAG: Myo-inositol-1(Or 4)-monophosphatase [candidate division Zixibacteria bacterium RBG-1]|nr:MAG: Myo-inositol-1(Or 4)-monophosphatase [candidate division Zixibacteria bacterium RBG-1]OGC86561.1 MAG: inositol monophosphatase [candidate division Zixibacteria bacterium RBG_19FT_COMBO_42_43]